MGMGAVDVFLATEAHGSTRKNAASSQFSVAGGEGG